MKLGIFAKTYLRKSTEEVFAAVARDRLTAVQFNLAVASLPTLPDEPVTGDVTDQIHRAARGHGIELVAVSGTFNMAAPHASVRAVGLRRLLRLIAWAAEARVPVVTLCSGTRDPEDMWRAHPENSSSEARVDFTATLEPALAAAEEAGVTLAVEPEPANVIADARTARRLLDELGTSHLKVILDPANLADLAAPGGDRDGLARAIDLLAADTVVVHGKDRLASGEVCPAGAGVIDFYPFLQRLHRVGYEGPVVIHGVEETEVPAAVQHLQQILDQLAAESIHAPP